MKHPGSTQVDIDFYPIPEFIMGELKFDFKPEKNGKPIVNMGWGKFSVS
jgi:hypothetical protein